MTQTAVVRLHLETASRALMAALSAAAASTEDDDLRSLLDASRAAVERETEALARASHEAIAAKISEFEWRLSVLVSGGARTTEPRPPGWGRDAHLTDFLVDGPAGER